MDERFWARIAHVARAECICGWWAGGNINACQARNIADLHAAQTGHPVSVVTEVHEVLHSAVPEARDG